MKTQEARVRSVFDGLGLFLVVVAISLLFLGVVFGVVYWLAGRCLVLSGRRLEQPEVERVRAFIAGTAVSLLLLGIWLSGMH
ncbi:MAG: hypothetical protein ABMA26_21470 [Limisphaerales bacterium]